MNEYNLAITITRLEDDTYMANCKELRATATGDTKEDVVKNLTEAIDEMIKEFGTESVFQDVIPNSDICIIEYAA